MVALNLLLGASVSTLWAAIASVWLAVASYSVLGAKGKGGAGTVDGSYYVSLTSESYYTDGGEPPGKWFGQAARALGLVGTVDRDPLRNLLAGMSLDGKTELVKIQHSKTEKRRSRAPGFDVTFSVPKSVSVAFALSGENTRKIIRAAIDRATLDVLSFAESTLPLARRGKCGTQQEAGKLVCALFDHSTSRAGDPQLHRHCVIVNLCQRQDGTWRTINSKLLASWVRTLGPAFRLALAKELREKLGYELYRPLLKSGKRSTSFEIRGISKRVCQHWSSRRGQLLDVASGKEFEILGGVTSAKARERANLLSRQSKAKVLPLAVLLEGWRNTALRLGINLDEITKLVRPFKAQNVEAAYRKAWTRALRELTEQHAHFSNRELIQKMCEALQTTAIGLDQLLAWVDRDLAHHKDIVQLKQFENEDHYTTREMWQLEEKLLAAAERLTKATGPVLDSSSIDLVIRRRKTISPDQEKAVRELLGSSSRLRILAGVAGSGKSFTLDAMRSGLQLANYTVIGGALAGTAAEELQKASKIKSRTVASYLWHLDKSTLTKVRDRVIHDAKQLIRAAFGRPTAKFNGVKVGSNTALVVDEAGMLDTRTLYRLIRIAERKGSTLILAGDDKQLAPIEAGAPFGYLLKKHGHSFLAENRRQQDAADRKAVAMLRAGKGIEKMLQGYAERGCLTVAKDKSSAVNQLVKTWAANGGKKRPQEHVIFTETRAEAEVVNRLCQRERLKSLKIMPLVRVRINGQSFHLGDRVKFNEPLGKYSIRNGYRGKVVRINPTIGFLGTITIKLDKPLPKRTIFSKTIDIVTIPVHKLRGGKISLGYASSTHTGQGQTVKNSYLLLGGAMTSREIAYVQATRAKHKTQIFTDELHAGKDLKDLARAVEKSKAKNLARDVGLKNSDHQLVQRLEIERGRS